jgi:hypothetical protein
MIKSLSTRDVERVLSSENLTIADDTSSRQAVAVEPRMNATAVICRLVTLSCLVFVFSFTAYRATVQAIAHDEAWTYLDFLDGGAGRMLSFETNNHVLFTLMAKPFVKILGITELSLRAPSLLGCGIYLVATFLLCNKLFGDTPLLPMTVAVLTLNPTIMDFLAAARGYGLGLAFLASAMYLFVCVTANQSRRIASSEQLRQCTVASAFLALSVAANLSNLVPAIGLAVGFLAVVFEFRNQAVALSGRRLREFTQCLVLPGAAIGLSILWPYLIQARPKQFFFGHVSIRDASRDFFDSTFLYRWTPNSRASLGADRPASNNWQQRVSDIGARVVFPVVLTFVVGSSIFLRRTPTTSPSDLTFVAILFVNAAVGCIALVFLLHFSAHVKYPLSRTALYAVPLGSICAILMLSIIHSRCSGALRPIVTSIGLVLMLAVIVDYAASLNMSYFRYNAYDRISRDVFLAIMKDAQPQHRTDLRIGGTWLFQPEIDFYRRRYNAAWLLPYDIKDRSHLTQAKNSLTPSDYDYFLYKGENEPDLKGRNARVLFRDSATNLTAIAIDK